MTHKEFWYSDNQDYQSPDWQFWLSLVDEIEKEIIKELEIPQNIIYKKHREKRRLNKWQKINIIDSCSWSKKHDKKEQTIIYKTQKHGLSLKIQAGKRNYYLPLDNEKVIKYLDNPLDKQNCIDLCQELTSNLRSK